MIYEKYNKLHNCTTAQLHNCNKIASYYVLIVTVVALLFAANLQAQQYPAEEGYAFEDALYFYKWINQEYPPLPDVKINGGWVTWEEAYGPLTPQEPILIRKSKSKAARQISEKDRWISIKRELAPTMTEAQLRVVPPIDTNVVAVLSRQAELGNSFVSLGLGVLAEQTRINKNLQLPGELSELSLTESSGGVRSGTSTNLNLYLVRLEQVDGNTLCDFWMENISTNQFVELFFTTNPVLNNWDSYTVASVHDVEGSSYVQCSVIVPGIYAKGFFIAFIYNDVDGDGLSDGLESMVFRSNPENCDSNFLRDANGDGTPDFLGKAENWICDGDEDLDGDGWSNADEIAMGTDPFVAQNNSLDTDNDGLPDWVENLIYVYTGILNPSPDDDADNDGISNYSEIAYGTNPVISSYEYFSRVWCNYFLENNYNRVFNIEFNLKNNTSGSLIPNGLMFDAFNILGTFVHLEVLRNASNTNGINYDKIKLSSAYLTPYSTNWFIPELSKNSNGIVQNKNVLDEGLLSTTTLLSSSASILEYAWNEPGAIDSIDDLSEAGSAVIRERSMGRIGILMRRLQLLGVPLVADIRNQPPAMQRKICNLVSNILSEINVYNHTTTRLSNIQGGFPVGTWGGHILFAGNLFFSVLNASNITPQLEKAFDDYIAAVLARSDPGGINTADLAAQLGGYIASVADYYPANVLIDYLWLVLQNFYGFFSSY